MHFRISCAEREVGVALFVLGNLAAGDGSFLSGQCGLEARDVALGDEIARIILRDLLGIGRREACAERGL